MVSRKGIGKNAKEDVKVVENKRRAGKQGLGFVDDLPVPPTNNGNNRGGNSKKEDICLKKLKEISIKEKVPKDATGSRNHSKRSREKHEISASSSSVSCHFSGEAMKLPPSEKVPKSQWMPFFYVV